MEKLQIDVEYYARLIKTDGISYECFHCDYNEGGSFENDCYVRKPRNYEEEEQVIKDYYQPHGCKLRNQLTNDDLKLVEKFEKEGLECQYNYCPKDVLDLI